MSATEPKAAAAEAGTIEADVKENKRDAAATAEQKAAADLADEQDQDDDDDDEEDEDFVRSHYPFEALLSRLHCPICSRRRSTPPPTASAALREVRVARAEQGRGGESRAVEAKTSM